MEVTSGGRVRVGTYMKEIKIVIAWIGRRSERHTRSRRYGRQADTLDGGLRDKKYTANYQTARPRHPPYLEDWGKQWAITTEP